MKKIIIILALTLGCIGIDAQVFEKVDSRARENVIVADGFWKHWFVQLGLDMSLQNPYGYNFAHVFPNGKTFGLDVAVGKWFTPMVGYRGKFNWENKLPLLKNDHANWLAPFGQPGVNRDKGGYIAFYGDVLLNVKNIVNGRWKTEDVRTTAHRWDVSLYPRVGVDYNFGVNKGALLLGLGLVSTYRINERWSLYGDAAYIMTGSGFVGKDAKANTGTGSNSNGFFTIGLGAQYELGKLNTNRTNDTKGVLSNGIWDNWFVQAGMDMSLMNPYGCNFGKVIPKGMTFGLNAAMGKWFSPEFALRGRIQWENGLIPNNGVEWLPPANDPKQNYKKGGLATFALDAMLNLTNTVKGYDPERKWHTSGYVRAGIISQFVEGSASPLAGIGLEETYRMDDRLSIFGSLGYQVSTSEGMGYGHTGMDVAAGSNGFFDIDFGVRYYLGQNKFYRSLAEKKSHTDNTDFTDKGHNWPRFVVNTVASVGVAYVGKTALKAMIKEERPDYSDNKSFPSGHTAMAFAAARSIDKEFRKESIWIPIAGYATATAIGVERVVNDRHHWYDVVAGAAVGIGSTELTWWLSDKLFGKNDVMVGTSGQAMEVVVNTNFSKDRKRKTGPGFRITE